MALFDDVIKSGQLLGNTQITLDANSNVERHYMSVVFYSDSNYTTVANPTGGNVVITASESGEQYGSVATIAASTAGVDSSYDRPFTNGPISKVNVLFDSVTGANYFKFRLTGYIDE